MPWTYWIGAFLVLVASVMPWVHFSLAHVNILGSHVMAYSLTVGGIPMGLIVLLALAVAGLATLRYRSDIAGASCWRVLASACCYRCSSLIFVVASDEATVGIGCLLTVAVFQAWITFELRFVADLRDRPAPRSRRPARQRRLSAAGWRLRRCGRSSCNIAIGLQVIRPPLLGTNRVMSPMSPVIHVGTVTLSATVCSLMLRGRKVRKVIWVVRLVGASAMQSSVGLVGDPGDAPTRDVHGEVTRGRRWRCPWWWRPR